LTLKLAELFAFNPHRPPFRIDPTKIPFELISEIRRETGQVKLDAAISFICEQSEGYQQKIVIYAHHLNVLEALQDAFEPRSVLVTVQTSLKARRQPWISSVNNPDVGTSSLDSSHGRRHNPTASSHVCC
jgi:hypothetical protein